MRLSAVSRARAPWEAFAWVLIALQLLLVWPRMGYDAYQRLRFRYQWKRLQRSGEVLLRKPLSPPNEGLVEGLHVPALRVRSVTGGLVDLRSATAARQAILFVSGCASCTVGIIGQYDGLARQGLPVCVIARAAPEQIAQASRENHWRVPIYSDLGLPQAANACRVVYRPAVLVLNRTGRVLYGQGMETDSNRALAQVQRRLKEGGTDGR